MLSQAVTDALTARPAEPCDSATAELARTYAALIDDAAPSAALAKAIDTISPHIPADPAAADAWRKITTALAEHSVASDLGPKLLAALDALQLTPRARAAAKKAVTPNDKPANSLDQLAAARARKSRAEAVDAPAP
jgi:hypothetical protein